MAASLLLACNDPTLTPTTETAAPVVPSFSAGDDPACPASPDVVVTTEGQLVDALATAAAGAVIGLDGVIPITADVIVSTPNITLTCATPGSGLVAQAEAGVIEVVTAAANGVSVDRLLLDASNASDPFFADGVADVRFTNNSVLCGPTVNVGSCGFLNATPNAVVRGNQFRSTGSFTGLHLQAGIDGTRIEDNTITTTTASMDVPIFGGLRIRDGANVVIARNTVRGPWANSAGLADLDASLIEYNDFDGAVVFGIRARSGLSLRSISMTDNVFLSNRISGAGSAGIFLTSACRNQLAGNLLEGNAGDVGLVFDAATGANAFAGNQRLVVDNGGALDCDGDGIGDPNIISGPGLARRGGHGPPPDTSGTASSRLR
jgi:hypothetical protein